MNGYIVLSMDRLKGD